MEDFLHLDDLLTSEEILMRDTVRQFVNKNVLPVIGEAYENATFPPSLSKEVAELGLFGLTLPENVGGANASNVAYGLICQELERGDSGLRSFVSVQSSLCMTPIYLYGSPEQQQHWLPRMAKGEIIGCFGLTEADAGSDPGSMKTTATPVSGGWQLNGSKLWITNANLADVAIVWAKTPDGIRGFLVEKHFEGFQANPIKHKLSLRASNTGELVFQNCFVPDSHYLEGSHKGLSAPLACLSKARYGIAWGAMGAAMACYETALDYTKTRKQFGKPIAGFQLVQKSLVDMFTEIVKAQTFHLRLGRLQDEGKASYVMISMAKMNACQQALAIAREARNLLGANGISGEYPVMRHLSNLETVFTYEGTDNMHHLIIGRHLTGESAFS